MFLLCHRKMTDGIFCLVFPREIEEKSPETVVFSILYYAEGNWEHLGKNSV